MARCGVLCLRLGLGRVQSRLDPFQAGFGVDQELRRDHDPLAHLQAASDLGLATALGADLHLDRPEVPAAALAIRHDHHRSPAGLDDRLGRHQQGLAHLQVRELHLHGHTRYQSPAGVGEFEPRLQRAGRRVDLGQERLHLSVERHLWHGRALCPDSGARAKEGRLALWHLGVGPHRAEAVQTEQRGAGRHGHAFAHRQFGDHAADRRQEDRAGLRLSAALHRGDLGFVHPDLAHALTGRLHQRREVGALHAAHRQELLLRGDPVRHVQLGQCLPLGHAVKRGPHMQALDVAGSTGLHGGLVAFVEGDAADSGDGWRQRALGDRHRAHAQVLLQAGADRDGAAFAGPAVPTAVRVDGHQHHVHEGRLGGLVEPVPGHHGVVVVQDPAAGGRIDIAGLEARREVSAGGVLALRDALRDGLRGRRGRRWRGGHAHAALQAGGVQAVAGGGQDTGCRQADQKGFELHVHCSVTAAALRSAGIR